MLGKDIGKSYLIVRLHMYEFLKKQNKKQKKQTLFISLHIEMLPKCFHVKVHTDNNNNTLG